MGIPREIIIVFYKQKRVNKEERGTKKKQELSCQQTAEEQITAYLVSAHIYVRVRAHLQFAL